MNFVDYIILGFLLIGFILGYKDGLVRKIIGLLGFIVSIGLAFEFADTAGNFLQPFFNNDFALAKTIGGIIIFFVAILIVAILKRVLHPVDKVNRFVNQLLGGISGLVQMIFFVSAILILLAIFNFPSEKDRNESVLYSSVHDVIPMTVDLIMGKDSETKSFLNNYLDNE
ncbi:MAG: CvpA family protein [Ignavibacteria bacterium]|nr:MAG: CvpA family protein [Ignavibacteria bacterium]